MQCAVRAVADGVFDVGEVVAIDAFDGGGIVQQGLEELNVVVRTRIKCANTFEAQLPAG